MNLRKYVNISMIILVSITMIAVSINLLDNSEDQEESIPIEFSLLDLTDNSSVKASITSYLVNRNNKPNEPIKIINQETFESDYPIIIELLAIKEVNVTFANHTSLSQVRFFTASYIDNSKPNNATYLTGWIDENRRVQASNWIWWVASVRGRNSTLPNIWIPFLSDEYCINKFLETVSESGFEYWNVTIGPVEVSELTESEGKSIRMFSAYTKWLNSTVYWPYAGYITEDLEISYIRLA